jgi:hypothetical protein
MKIAIITGLPAKGNMKINTGHIAEIDITDVNNESTRCLKQACSE